MTGVNIHVKCGLSLMSAKAKLYIKIIQLFHYFLCRAYYLYNKE